MTTQQITPAEIGYLAVALDDANAQGLGDDDTVDMLRDACRANDIDTDAAYLFFRASLSR